MSYYFSTTVNKDFDTAVEYVKEELKKEDFGVLTSIDVKTTLKKKLDKDFNKYTILGACNPPCAFDALSTEKWIGLMLPCNVVVREDEQGSVHVAAIDPIASMKAVANPDLSETAKTVQRKLKDVIKGLN